MALRCRRAQAVDENGSLKAQLAPFLAAEAAARLAAEQAAAAAAAAAAARLASAGSDAAAARAFVLRTFRAQLVYSGGDSRLRAHLPGLSAEAFAALAGAERPRSFDVPEAEFQQLFGAAAPFKALRYGSVLAPEWPVRRRLMRAAYAAMRSRGPPSRVVTSVPARDARAPARSCAARTATTASC